MGTMKGLASTYLLGALLWCAWLGSASDNRSSLAPSDVTQDTAGSPSGGKLRLPKASSSDGEVAKIPRILHQVLLTPKPGDERAPKANLSAYTANWRKHCQEVFSDWEYRLWDNEAADELIRSQYPDFLYVWETYDMVVLRGDAIRPFIMETYGGLYIDSDTECYKPADEFLDGYSMVFQAEQNEGADFVNNGAMASAIGHPFWQGVIANMVERAFIFDRGANYATVAEGDWETNILWRVGPLLMRETFAEYKQAAGVEPRARKDIVNHYASVSKHALKHSGRHYKVWPVGTFYFPCNWKNSDYCFEVDRMGEKPGKLAGRHFYGGTWRGTNSHPANR